MEAQIERLYSEMKYYNDNFKRLRYEGAFEAYLYANRQYLQELRDKIDTYDSPDKAISKMSKLFVSRVKNLFSGKEGSLPSWETQLSLNMFTTSYVLPAMLSMDSSFMKQLAEEIAVSWRKTFKKSNISCATFQQLSEGFKTRPCYITTAVCQSQGKEDSCYELRLLRSYRDMYLANTPGGEGLISQYYEMAPAIVMSIDTLPDKADIYHSIYQKLLLPCIHLIEESKMPEAMEAYKAMAEELYKKYVS